MKNLLLSLIVLCACNLNAAPVKSYTCLGVESYASEETGVKFQVVYSDWVQSKGYAYESVELTSTFFGEVTLDLKYIRDENRPSDCTGGFIKEFEELGNKEVKYFEINDGNCEGVPSYKLKGYCEQTR